MTASANAAMESAPLAADLADHRRALEVTGGAGRLLRELVRRGLREEHVRTAAMLVLELDAGAGR
jgi:hypothetical protein